MDDPVSAPGNGAPKLQRAPSLATSVVSRPKGHWRQASDVVLTHLGLKRPRAAASRLEGLRRRALTLPGPDKRVLSWLESGGDDAQPVVLLHGTPGDAAGWGDYLADPPPGMRVLAPDRLGFGHSASAGAEPSLDAQADAVAACLSHAGCAAAIVLGHSLGGAVAANLAARHPWAVKSLVLLAAALDPAQERIHPLQHVGRWPGVRQALPRAIAHANEELFALRQELVTLAPRLATVRCPVWVVHGTRDALVPPDNVIYAQLHLTSAAPLRIVWLDGQGHFLPWRAQSAVREVLGQSMEPLMGPSMGPRSVAHGEAG
jgi:pimeloyl-ACP methyl ester carboxylesterase